MVYLFLRFDYAMMTQSLATPELARTERGLHTWPLLAETPIKLNKDGSFAPNRSIILGFRR
jgi:hypothetical protein